MSKRRTSSTMAKAFSAVTVAAVYAVTAAVQLPTSKVEAGNAGARLAKSHGDSCGYRYAVWGLVQETANFVLDAKANLDDFHANERDNYLGYKMGGLGRDYHHPAGSKKLEHLQSSVLADAYVAITEGRDKGDGSTFRDELSKADNAVGKMWATVKGICRQGGRSRTNLGYLVEYAYGSRTTRGFTAHRKWSLWYDYICPPSQYGGSYTEPENFIIWVKGAGPDSLAVNDLKSDGFGIHDYSRKGYIALQVETEECAWRVQAKP